MTAKPVRRRRAKRHVETDKFDAFARRILRAYGARIATGDIEALATLVTLSAEVDVVVRLAVASLRGEPYRYSWQEIADRLGTTKQAVQQRFGVPADRHALDSRLREAGMGVTVATLVQVFADHHPGDPASSRCPGCGFAYPDGVSDCPTNATVRPLLYRRRREDETAVARLTPIQFADLHGTSNSRAFRVKVRQTAVTTPIPDRPALPLFHPHGRETA
jgi:hypothetical protein